jgi:hypothetical protein
LAAKVSKVFLDQLAGIQAVLVQQDHKEKPGQQAVIQVAKVTLDLLVAKVF